MSESLRAIRARPLVLAGGGALLLAALTVVLVLAAGGPSPSQARPLSAVEVTGSLVRAVEAVEQGENETSPPPVAAAEQASPEPPADSLDDEIGEDAIGSDDEEEEQDEADDQAAERGGDGPSQWRKARIAAANRLVSRGHRLRRARRLGMAEAAYLKSLKALPGYPRALAGLVRVHLARRDGVEALRWAKRLVARKPNRGNNQLLLGDAHALMKHPKAARRAWRKAARYGNRRARKRLRR